MGTYFYETEESKAAAEEYKRGGISTRELAYKYSQTVAAMRKALRAHRAISSRGGSLTDEEKQEIAETYSSKSVPLKQLATKYHVSETTIHNVIVDVYGPDWRSKMVVPAGPARGGRKPIGADLTRTIVDAFVSGTSIEDISTHVGINQRRVINQLRNAGYTGKRCGCCGQPLLLRKQKYCSDECSRIMQKGNRLQNHFDISLDQFHAMLDEQGGKCAICGVVTDDIVVDHDHTTGKVRGLLCRQCNSGIGLFRDDPSVLQSAIRYLVDR